MLRNYTTPPENTDEFAWRRFYAGLVAQEMDARSVTPARAAPAARDRFIAEWRAKHGGKDLPFRIDIRSELSPVTTQGAPGGVEPGEGQVWLTAAYVEESNRTAFPEEERLTHDTLHALARNYDPDFRPASLTIPTGQGGSHFSGRRNPMRAGRVEAASSDGQHLWMLVRPQGFNLAFALSDGMEARSLSWIESLPDLEEPGPYPDHLAILLPGEQPGQAGHIPIPAFADHRELAEIAVFGEEPAAAVAATRALPDVVVRRRDFYDNQERNLAMSDEATAAAAEEASEPQNQAEETHERALPETQAAERTRGASETDVTVRTADFAALQDQVRAMGSRLEAAETRNAELLESNTKLATTVTQMEERRQADTASQLVQELDAGLETLVSAGVLKPGSTEATRAIFVDGDGKPRMDRAQMQEILGVLARSPAPSSERALIEFGDFPAPQEGGLSPMLQASVNRNGAVTVEKDLQLVMDHLAGQAGAKEVPPDKYPLLLKMSRQLSAGVPADRLLEKEN